MLGIFMQVFRSGRIAAGVRWINRDLAIGCPETESDWQAMRARGVRGVVDVSDGCSDLGVMVRRQGMRYLRLAVAHGGIPEPEELHIVTSWILQRADEGPVLIHDVSGRGNGELLACAALLKRGSNVYRARLQASQGLSDAQLSLLYRFAGEMAAARG